MDDSRVLHLPGGVTVNVLQGTRETGGELFEIELELVPGARGTPAHIHLGQEESFTVVDGLLSVRSGAAWQSLGAGEAVTVPSGTVHAFRNRTDRPVRAITQMTPALVFEHLLRIQAGSKVPPALRIAAINHGPDASFFLAGMPLGVQRRMWDVLALIAKFTRRG